jgi:nucleoside-diphosphate-sugar epimerase
MARVVVIGATGHVGTYLVPRLVRAGHEVVAISRGEREPYRDAPEWRAAERVALDRSSGDFLDRLVALKADAVIDMVCFTAAEARALVDALRPSRPLLVHCGTIWVHGPALRVPVTEDEPRTAYGDYGIGKAEIEALLCRETLAGGVPSVILHPGHISGPGWNVITPAGNLDNDVWRRLATGEPVALPDLGLGVLHHVHADDVAQAFERALTRPEAIGSSVHVWPSRR